MAEVQIADLPTREAPLERTTKPSEAYLLLAARAVFDGTGAAGDFRPALEVVSDAGLVVGTYPTDETVTAGGSAEVSFAPFLRNATGATPAGTSDLLYDYTLTVDQPSIDTAVDGPMAGSLSSGYAALDFCAVLRADDAGVGTGDNAQLIVNGDNTAAHYALTNMEWFGVTAGSPTGGPINSQRWTWRIPAAAATAKYFGQVKGTFEAYADGEDRNRTVQLWAGDNQITTAPTGFLNFVFGIWKDTTAIDRIAVQTQSGAINLVAGSRLSVFGRGKL